MHTHSHMHTHVRASAHTHTYTRTEREREKGSDLETNHTILTHDGHACGFKSRYC